jgi:hypothetical protein
MGRMRCKNKITASSPAGMSLRNRKAITDQEIVRGPAQNHPNKNKFPTA